MVEPLSWAGVLCRFQVRNRANYVRLFSGFSSRHFGCKARAQNDGISGFGHNWGRDMSLRDIHNYVFRIWRDVNA